MRAQLSLLVLGIVALTVCPVRARAQSWLADRERAEGNGIRLGDFELHPGVGSEIGYDSNVFLSEAPESSPVLRIAPHFYVSTLSGDRLRDAEIQRLSLRAGVSGTLKHYFATTAGTDVGVGQDAKLTWRPGAVFALELSEEFQRSTDPFTEPAAPSTNPIDTSATTGQDITFGRDQLSLGARAQLHTPGDVFKVGLGYKFGIDHFESDAFRDNRSNSHTVTGDTSWEFLPKTALFWDGAVARNNFIHSTGVLSAAERAAEISERHDSTAVKTRLGINGALTSSIAFTIAGGYGVGFFANNADYESVIAQLEGRWQPRQDLILRLGYDREFMATFQGNFARMDRFKSALQMMLASRVVITTKAEATLLDFGTDPVQGGRNDVHLHGSLSGEYRLVDWLAITAEANYWQNITDFVFVSGTGAAATTDPAKYKRVEAWLGLRAFL